MFKEPDDYFFDGYTMAVKNAGVTLLIVGGLILLYALAGG